ncbi:MAG: YheV family putative zinc ribbon protein [Pseudomonadota bacterium]|nr:YheV family putative zinc ribbon protein [Pseudomonadota bacterium]
MTEGAPKRRFIAGAVCPRCAALDRIVSWEADGRQHRACVECDFQDSQPLTPEDELVPRGRLDAPRPIAPATAQPIRFYPRAKKSD